MNRHRPHRLPLIVGLLISMIAGLAACGNSSSSRQRNSILVVACADGGACKIGDVGPGGGTVFVTPLTPGNSKADYYMEAAPLNGFAPWGCADGGKTGRAIGDGKANTLELAKSCLEADAMTAVALANDLEFNGKDDWFLPSEAELVAMYANKEVFACPSNGLCSSNFTGEAYWSSSIDAANNPVALNFAEDGGTAIATAATENIGVRAVRGFYTLPGAAKNVVGTAGDKEVALTWTEPDDNGSKAIISYIVKYSTEVDGTYTTFTGEPIVGKSTTVDGLMNGVAYFFTVTAVNGNGAGSESVPSSSVTPRGTPDAPTDLRAVADSTAGVDLSWSAPEFNGGAPLRDYVIEYATGGGDFVVFEDAVSTSTSVKMTGLAKGVSYNFRVSAKNEVGQGNASSPVVNATPRTVPSAPSGTTRFTIDGAIEVQWEFVAPATNGGSEVIEYAVDWALNSSPTWTNSGKFANRVTKITGLTPGQVYKFRATATNAAGTGPYSATVTATPRVPPQSPTNLTFKLNKGRGTRNVSLEWDPPTDTGGTPITDYEVSSCVGEVCEARPRVTPMNSAMPARTPSFAITPGTYTFYVAAVNAAGRQICADKFRCGASVVIVVSD